MGDGIEEAVWDILKEDQKALGLTRGNFLAGLLGISGALHLTPEEQRRGAARGFRLGQLAHLAAENEQMALTFDDIAGSPYRALTSRQDADVSTYLTNGIRLNMPIISSNMECVTGHELAIAMAQMGGLGILHQFSTPAEQAAEVYKVKKANVEPKDIDGMNYPSSLAKDGHYLVAAAIGVRNGLEERVKRLVDAGVDMLVVDIAHGHADQMLHIVGKLKSVHPNVPVAAGNVATPTGAYELCEAGADVIKVGVGPGAACTTRIVTGYGIPQITAIYEASLIANKYHAKVMADGGIRNSGDIVKALAAGADTVMVGALLAATDRSNNFESRIIKRDGKGNPIEILYYGSASEISKYKQGRGNFDTPEGRKVLLTYGGDTYVALARMITGIQSGISYAGVRRDSEAIANIFGLKTLSRWMRQSPAGFLEGSKT